MNDEDDDIVFDEVIVSLAGIDVAVIESAVGREDVVRRVALDELDSSEVSSECSRLEESPLIVVGKVALAIAKAAAL